MNLADHLASKPDPIGRTTFRCTLVRETLCGTPGDGSITTTETCTARVVLDEFVRTRVLSFYSEPGADPQWKHADNFSGRGSDYDTHGDWRISEAVPEDQETTP